MTIEIATGPKPALESTIEIPADVLFRNLESEAVALNLTTGQYYGLDEMATQMWTLLAAGQPLSEVIDLVTQDYDVERAQVESDLLDLVSQLRSYGLVRLVEG